MIGAQSNLGAQDVIDGEGANGDSDGSEVARPPRGCSNVIAGGCPAFFRFCSSFLAASMVLSRFLSLGAVGGVSGSSLSDPNADANKEEMLIASSACRLW